MAVGSKRAHDRDPLAPIVNDHLGLSYSLAGFDDQALRQLQQAIEIDPAFFLAHYRIGWVHLRKEDPDSAIPPLERAVELSEGKYALGMLGYAYGWAGRTKEAIKAGARLQEEAAARYVSPLEMALVRAGLGDADGAFPLLERAVEDRVSDLVLFYSYPWRAAIRNDPRFPNIAREVGL